MTNDRDPDLERRRFSDAAMVLPFAGVFLLMPPFIQIFATDSALAGIPLIVLYLFAVWFALILIAWRLAGPLRRAMQTAPHSTSETAPPEA
ncbi:hypothetical protein [Microbaculum marinisediminis]|uniref:DUF3311 domain-containing protein n=1 Tax=Microbaculum marinisediminis TaxID=2931392 RepID=A0AAW5QUF4_9HYPH|nr:hypothetical protein [Microbaculum sp. A6E488]MCT8970529.1 hypothetical protein [Microbaculum sp. A6E488]